MKSINHYLLVIVPVLFMVACSNEIELRSNSSNTEDIDVNFNLSLPAQDEPSVEQAGTQNENTILKINILAYKVNSAGKEHFDYHTEGVLQSGAGTALQTYSAKVKVRSYKQRFVIIANARDEVTQILHTYAGQPIEKIEMLKMLEFTNAAPDHKWNISNTAGFTPIPMWGETQTPQQITTATASIDKIPMLRMVAKVDVLLVDQASGKKIKDHFKLSEIYLYNIKENSRIVPDTNTLELYSNNRLIVTKPTLATSQQNWFGPIKYVADSETSLLNTIYLSESRAVVLSSDFLNATGFVIGGYYSENGIAWDSAPSYYRLDIMTGDKTETRDILRNHSYQLNIIQVNGSGHPTAEKAWNRGTDMNLMVADWSTQVISENVLKRQLHLSATEAEISDVSASRIYFWSDQKEVKVEKQGYIGYSNTSPFNVNDFFDDLAGSPLTTNFQFNPVSGHGHMDISTISTQKTTNDIRKIYLNAGGLKREIIVKTNISDPPKTFLEIPWVGTFHRKNEVGERVIYADHIGAWSAEVNDPTGEGHFVVLSKSRSADKSLRTENPGDAENYPVVDGKKTISGNGRIYFRVGLTSTYQSTPTKPVRYATIKLTHSKGYSTIYVRQGEDADYLMRMNDPTVGVNPSIPKRPFAKKFSPYNLTDPQERPGRVGDSINSKYVFTQFPTQAGYYFQFARTYAWYPDVEAPENWYYNRPNALWYLHKNDWESAPAGYRRPNEGSISSYATSTSSSDLEISQSLLLDPKKRRENDDANTLWGYYADGFFDRRPIRKSLTGTEASTVGSGAKLAYIGQLHFNPYTNASLFFPAAGYRASSESNLLYPIKGGLRRNGERVYFWSTATRNDGNSWLYRSSKENKDVMSASLLYGYNIRCVKDE
ncbi:FimB/Mfa2 family fimbrial subunit [Massilibacteroides vaginae]|uniref:FimB/Mfa2 family fimbrial subunit n=1 Tax=Massilibacteroides vaginae TaxID=1673718 RepID=UPI000A1CA214|nr:FimB/Mfa2 family fimbrial subunit [Massilibacteroides vaginae]